MNIPKDILDKIDEVGNKQSGEGMLRVYFKSGATFGYSLSQSELADLLEWIAIFYGALSELIEVKRIKDTYGKSDPDYLERQPKAWHLAKQGIELWKLSDYGAKPLPNVLSEKDKRIEELENKLEFIKEEYYDIRKEDESLLKDMDRMNQQLTEANKEIERLKANLEAEHTGNYLEVDRLYDLIKKMWFKDIHTGYDHLFDDETKEYYWQQFKQENNL